jgi:hypothetical protein
MLAHGGMQVQIEQTKAALERIGIETAYLEWWDDHQTGDVLHHFADLPVMLIPPARKKGWKVVNTILLSGNCNRPRLARLLRRGLIQTVMAAPLPAQLKSRFRSFRMCDRVLVSLEAEKEILVRSYGVQEQRVRTIPLGLAEPFMKAGPGPRTGDYLITHGTIAPVKGSIELARLAIEAQVPVLFVGKPFSTTDSYWAQFQQLVDDRCVRYRPHGQHRGDDRPAAPGARLCAEKPLRELESLRARSRRLRAAVAAAGSALVARALRFAGQLFPKGTFRSAGPGPAGLLLPQPQPAAAQSPAL